MLNCDICKTEGHYKLRSLGKGVWACKGCLYTPAPAAGVGLSKTVLLNGSYKTTEARIRELERRVILPYSQADGGYAVGRRGENGRIQEREPNYR
jgi:hypothetical protein